MGTFIQVSQFILSLSILIVLHELGHFVPAKLFKTKVEKFYLFFDPWFSLFKIKRGDTEYGIGWLPLGGYVKISGMIDESMDKEQMKLPPQPWEFRSKPAWQRLIIMVGGVTVNVILGILIYAMVLFHWGEEQLPVENVKYGVAVDSLGYKIGLRDGDKVISVNDQKLESIDKIGYAILVNEGKSIEVEREGKKLSFPITEDDISEMIKTKSSIALPRFPFIVDSVVVGGPAERVKFQKDDQLISVNDKATPYFSDVVNVLQKSKYTVANVKVLRQSDTVLLRVPVTGEGMIGLGFKPFTDYLQVTTKNYGFFESFPAGVSKAGQKISDYVSQMKVIFTVKDAHKEIGGFMTIGKAYSKTWNWQAFWTFTAFLSIVLAVMNILPIPALDGGHVMFLLYEVIARRKPNEKFMEYAQYAGMMLLLALLLYANGNDVVRLFD